jgi:hypothetical protein
VKRDLKDWSITKELAFDRRECKLAIHMPEPLSLVPSLLFPFFKFIFAFIHPFSVFWSSVLLPFLLFLVWFCMTLVLHPCFIPVFQLMCFHLYPTPTCLGLKGLIVIVIVIVVG